METKLGVLEVLKIVERLEHNGRQSHTKIDYTKYLKMTAGPWREENDKGRATDVFFNK
jgi:hypothetical protein